MDIGEFILDIMRKQMELQLNENGKR